MKKQFLNKSLIFILILVLALTMTLCGKRPSKPDEIEKGDYSYTKEHIEYELSKLIKQDDIIGISASLINEEGIVWQKAFGKTEKGKEENPLTLDNTYKAGSLSHIIIMIAILKLYNDGAIDIDAPINTYLPDFSIKSRFKGESSLEENPITIRSILIHRSGLPRDVRIASGIMEFSTEKLSIEQVLDELKNTYTAYPVFYKYKESNVGIDILGEVIQSLTGENLNNYIEKNILSPLDMNNTSFEARSEIVNKLATGYRKIGKDKIEAVEQHNRNNIPSGNIYSNINDLNKLLMMIFNEGKVYNDNDIKETDSERFLKIDNVKLMFKDGYSKPFDPQEIGLCWTLSHLPSGELIAMYSGNTGGYSSYIALMPEEKLGLVMMSNSSSFAMERTKLATKTLKLMLEAKKGTIIEDKKKDNKTDVVNVSQNLLKQYEGIYTFGGMIGKVSSAGGKLKFKLLNMDTIPVPVELDLSPINDNTFRPTHWVMDTFIKDQPDLRAKFLSYGDSFNPFMDILKDNIIVLSINNNFYLTASKLKKNGTIPEYWRSFTGKYEAKTVYGDELMIANIETLDESFLVLEMVEITHPEFKQIQSGPMPFPTISIVLNPVNEKEILLVGGMMGIYDGETMYYDKEKGSMHFLDIVLEPIE